MGNVCGEGVFLYSPAPQAAGDGDAKVKNLFDRCVRAIVACAASSVLLAGCGGGGGGGDTVAADTPPPAPATLSGVAAQGAPMKQAAMSLTDATGTVVATATADDDGKYSLTVPTTAKAPMVLSASSGDTVYYSPVAEAKTETVNVTKLTNLIAAQLSPTGDPSALAAQIAGGTAKVDVAQVQAVVTAVLDALKPLLQNTGDSTDPISGAFDANGSGHDKVLMALDISINPTGTASNITVTVKVAVADGDQAPAITFTSGTTPPALPQTVATASLPADDTDQLVADLMTRLEACYALPRTQRVSGTTAASVAATECRTLFTQDDPTLYKNNGAGVGANAAFSGLYRDGATGVKFVQPSVEFLLANGKILVSWKNVATDGGISFARVWVQRENGSLKIVGNGNAYPFSVRAWSELRDYLNHPELTYWDTGFDVNVGNITSSGTPVFDHVVVTAPNGHTIQLSVNPGLSYLPIQGTSTSVVRLAGKFVNPATTGVPRRLTGVTNGEGLAWATNPDGTATDWSDAQISSINNVGRWKADFYLASDPSTIAATQYYETSTRPLTIAELQVRSFAGLTTGARSDAVAGTSATGSYAFQASDKLQLDVSGTPSDFWTVPTGATPPTLIQGQGFVVNAGNPAPRWNDNTTVSSVARTALINCTAQSGSDQHCGTPSGTYSTNARLNLVQLIGYDAKDMEWVSNFPLYLLQGIN